MSYICQHTGKVVPPNIPEHRVVVKTRRKVYENQVLNRKGEPTGDIKLTEGTEIVKEIKVSPEAYTELTGLQPRRLPETKKPIPKQRTRTRKNSRPVTPWRNPKKDKQFSNAPRKQNKPKVQYVNKVSNKK